jgi:hypothetical protein
MKSNEAVMKLSLAILLLTTSLLCAQSPAQAQPASASAHFSFEQRWPAADPQWFALEVQPDGSTKYRSMAGSQNASALSADSATAINEFSFTLSPLARQLVFSVASSLARYQPSLDKTKVAFTGTKTLRYQDGAGNPSAISYNYSSSTEITALTELMQGISEDIQFSETLRSQLRFDKLALDDTLKGIETRISFRRLPEPQILEPILTRIAEDSAIMNIARQRARHILQTEAALKTK